MSKLDATHTPPQPLTDRTIVLVGIMGVGKTTIGKRLAKVLNLPFHDADEEIEKASGMRVSDYFKEYGEHEFRKGERRVIRRLLKEQPHVLATGGGSFVDDRTRQLIKDKGVSVWLQADMPTILERTSRRDTRPLLQNDNPKATISKLLAERTPIYQQADIHVETCKGPHMKTAELIISALKEHYN